MREYLTGNSPRRQEQFGFDWQFAQTDAMEPPAAADWRPVQLPHDWSVHTPIRRENPSGGAGGFFGCGIGWYQKTFRVNRREKERITLYFEGVWKDCDLWVNAGHVIHHHNGYVSFAADVTDWLRPGQNECLLRVCNADQPNSRWYTGSGITREVWICATQPTHLREDGVCITTRGQTWAEISVRLELEGDWQGARAQLTLRDPAGSVAAQGDVLFQEDTAAAQLTLPRPALWSVETPHLYRLEAEILRGEACLDSLSLRFGVRDIRFDPAQGFLLNGTRVKLNGVCLHHDGGCVGAAVPAAVWRRRLQKLKAMGCNAVRCAHNPPDPAFLDLCDEMGFLVNAELFDEWREVKKKTYHNAVTDISHGYGEVFDRCARQDTLATVRRDRNHPSIILWSIGNEIPEQLHPQGVQLAQWLRELVRSQDGTRPVTTANDLTHAQPAAALDAFVQAADVVGLNYIDRWGADTELLYEPDKLRHPQRIYYGSEHSAIYGWRGDYTNAGESTSWFLAPYASRMLKAERLMKFTLTRDWVCGDFMWTGIDHLGESEWPRKSSISGVLDTAGFAKDGYYFYQSQWVKDRPVLHLFPWLNLSVAPGTIIPFVAYTNCASVELVVNGRSYGRKAYEFPAQGMRGHWDGFEHPISQITTNDLHLSWDVPYQEGIAEAIGYDRQGHEIARAHARTAGAPARLAAVVDRAVLRADGRDAVQVELTLTDAQGVTVPNRDLEVRAEVSGALRLLGMDNGDGTCHLPFDAHTRPTHCGRLYLIAQNNGHSGVAALTCAAPGVEPVRISLLCE